MLTPKFDLSQNEDFLIISIQLPYAKISEIDIHYEDTDFIFYSKPYYLRLNLPGKVLYSEEPTFDYDVDQKLLTIKAQKCEKGQLFEGLDLITKLLAPKKAKTSTPLIEVIEGKDSSQDDDIEEFDWSIEQVPCEELSILKICGDQCGFANSYSYAVFKMKEEVREIFDIETPQDKQPSLRRQERLKTELEHFNEDHYLADLYQDEEIQQLLKYRPEWEDLYDKFQSESSLTSADDIIEFTSKERERLLKLPNKEYILDKNQVKVVFLGLIDILFAYAYNKRTTEGENTVESGWTINKLSATLSWLEIFSSISDVAGTCIRRSLCYPLYRHFELSVTVLDDVTKILLLGRKYVIKCLLEIHELFCTSEPRYILNDLFITDYCVWMQTKSCSTNKLIPLANALGKILLTKGDIGFNLVDIESFAAVAWMSHNPSAKEFPTPIRRDKYTDAVKGEANTGKDVDDLCATIDDLSLQRKSNDTGACSGNAENYRTLGDIFDDYAVSCSSCTSGSSCSSSFSLESDSDYSCFEGDEESSSSSESEEDSDSSSDDDGAHRLLLKKENCEKYR